MTFIKNGVEYSTFLIQGKPFTRRLVRPNKTHGLSQSRIYNIWKGMRRRCNNPNAPKYNFYGGKGIKVCEEWNKTPEGFENFYNWAIQNGYADNLTIDRIDPQGNYCPENCRWLTLSENVHRAAIKPHNPEWEYYAYNPQKNLLLIFYKIRDFEIYSGVDSRRVSDGCKNPDKMYHGWYFSRVTITNSIITEGQETIPTGSTLGVELPAEVQIILLKDKDIVHSV